MLPNFVAFGLTTIGFVVHVYPSKLVRVPRMVSAVELVVSAWLACLPPYVQVVGVSAARRALSLAPSTFRP